VNSEQLNEYLQQLHKGLAQLPEQTVEREALMQLVQQLEQQLAADALPIESPPLADQVSELVSEFEVEHPTIAAVLNNILLTLANMGV
jgi:hypothetical protein